MTEGMARTTRRIGTTSTGEYVVVEAEIENTRNPGTRQTTTHGKVTDPYTLSVQGSVYDKGCREPYRSGQVSDALGKIVKPAAGWTLAEIADLRSIWDRWHLNTLQAACAHQTTIVYEDSAYGPRVDLAGTTAANDCPAGYRYGHAWLIEELPAEVIERVRHLMRDRSASLFAERGYDGSGHKAAAAETDRARA